MLVDIEALVEDFQANLDMDPRYWDQAEGVVRWHGVCVQYARLPDEFVLNIVELNVEVCCPRI